MNKSLIERDLEHIWHPCSQMKDYESFPPVEITRAKGSCLYTADGQEIIDIISSWWCKSLGHGHDKIQEAVRAQMDKFEHIILANTTNTTITELGELLAGFNPKLQKAFFADSGSDAVEIACKMSLQYHKITGQGEKTEFLALENGYHGETLLTLALGDCELYTQHYKSIMPNVPKISGIPYCTGEDDPIWHNCSKFWPNIEAQLDKLAETTSAILVEPLIQGAGGMLIYSADFLKRLSEYCTKNGVHLIADEIMTGFGRAGSFMACDYAGITPDFAVFSKGLTGGFLPMSVSLTSNKIFDAFYADYNSHKAFMHSHTHCGNALAAASAVAAIKVYQEEDTFAHVRKNGKKLKQGLEKIAKATGHLTNIRQLGYVASADLIDKDGNAYPGDERLGYQIYQEAVKQGLLLRPLGNSLYFLPPLNTSDELLEKAFQITEEAIKKVLD